MTQKEQQKKHDILCPFYERECPLGKRTARLCWRRFNTENELLLDYEEQWEVDCLIADWMIPNRKS